MKNTFTFIMLVVCMAANAQTDTIGLQTNHSCLVDTSLNEAPLVGTPLLQEYDLLHFRQPAYTPPASWFPDFNQGDYARNLNDIFSQRRGNPAKVIGLYLASITLNAIGDGLNDSGNKQWGHACNAMSAGIILLSPFVIDYGQGKWYHYLMTYTFLRVATFDIAYNATRGNSLTYVGGDNLWDSAMRQMSPSGLMFFRGLSFTMGFTIPIGELGRSCKRLSN